MANRLRKFKYNGPSGNRPTASPGKSTVKSPGQAQHATMETKTLTADILSSLRTDIRSIIKEEMKNVLSEDFNHLKSELQAMRGELANNTAAIRSEMDSMKANIKDVEGGLSTWSDEMVDLKQTVAEFKNQMEDLKEKCEDLEGRMRRGNIRITGVDEKPGSSSTTAVSSYSKKYCKWIKLPKWIGHTAAWLQGDREEDHG